MGQNNTSCSDGIAKKGDVRRSYGE